MSISDELEKLDALRRAGVLTDEEFTEAKRRTLDGAATRAHTGHPSEPAAPPAASCPRCGGALESVAAEVDGQMGAGGAKIMGMVALAVLCGVGPLTGGFGWLALLIVVPIWLVMASSARQRVRCVACGTVHDRST